MYNEIPLEKTIEESFSQYAGAVIQSRALVDVRDCIKPSARQIYYCMYTDNFVHGRPFNKTLKSIGSAMRLYIHGDSSCEGIIMRSGQPFSMRYPLVEVEGSFGNLTATENWAASRYTGSRLSELANYFFQETNENTVLEWANNYDDTEKYPRVSSSLGFYNIVNGTSGISVGIASSIPQFNIKEVNEALIQLLKNPDVKYEKIACFPDFATGGTIINKEEVYSSLEKGYGKGCVIQAKITYDEKQHCLIVEELPYSVYTNTVCSEITKLAENNPELGIIGLNDLTGEQVCIKIYLSKNVNAEEVKNFLFQKTSLQKTYGINMTMLKDGKYPEIFGWKDALLEHIKHEKKVFVNLFQQQLKDLKHNLKIVNGIIKAVNAMDNVVSIIKSSSSTKEAKEKLQNFLDIDTEQAKAILEIKLSRLVNLEIQKLLKNKEDLKTNIVKIESILNSEDLLKQQIINRLKEVSKKFGDDRRTEVIQKEFIRTVSSASGPKEKVIEDIVFTFNPLGYVQNIPLKIFRKGKFDAVKTTSDDIVLLFSNQGRYFRVGTKDIKSCTNTDKGTALGSVLDLQNKEKIVSMYSNIPSENKPYILFVTTNGKVKKTIFEQYAGKTRNVKGLAATNIQDDDSLLVVAPTNGNDIILFTKNKKYIRFAADEINPSGRNTTGVTGIKLAENDEVIKVKIVGPKDKSEYIKTKRAGKGRKYE